MTELLNPTRLRALAELADQSVLARAPAVPVPVLEWTLDARTGRPVSRWVLAENRVVAGSVPSGETVMASGR